MFLKENDLRSRCSRNYLRPGAVTDDRVAKVVFGLLTVLLCPGPYPRYKRSPPAWQRSSLVYLLYSIVLCRILVTEEVHPRRLWFYLLYCFVLGRILVTEEVHPCGKGRLWFTYCIALSWAVSSLQKKSTRVAKVVVGLAGQGAPLTRSRPSNRSIHFFFIGPRFESPHSAVWVAADRTVVTVQIK